MMNPSKLMAKPILKWAGGKVQLLGQIRQHLPQELLQGKINCYIEPFMGGGAVFFWMAQQFDIERFYLSDVNFELILLYKTVQKAVELLIQHLQAIESHYLALDEEQRKLYFLHQRETYNHGKTTIDKQNFSADWIIRAAEMIFLNKTCFNGLFRVNRKGDFNVPFGDYRHPKICHPQNLILASQLLQKAVIECQDFTQIREQVNSQTFVYFDPPYRPLTATSSFKSYSPLNFNDEEQIRLGNFYRELHQRGGKLMLSNSDPKNIEASDHFFDDLYAGFQIYRIPANRMINSNASRRGAISELLITNY